MSKFPIQFFTKHKWRHFVEKCLTNLISLSDRDEKWSHSELGPR